MMNVAVIEESPANTPSLIRLPADSETVEQEPSSRGTVDPANDVFSFAEDTALPRSAETATTLIRKACREASWRATRIDQSEGETVPDDPDQKLYCRRRTLPRICLEYGEQTQDAERMQMQDSNKKARTVDAIGWKMVDPRSLDEDGRDSQVREEASRRGQCD
ncbi:uncharacterized protein ACHE_61000A [Aspergillus chevalieri]|uniref:Uncharacterized protein n=1 Tax=Aspergillus chevalieri TaxID=182096 RepID=A0A7R7ZRX2_ASPCH|nr:uncharacterized protein ACHE_61000A [Aspergillus chevalieri]BCR91114.1 hypothetical protein ACHE_61000A [Aspergillus chevalieri]